MLILSRRQHEVVYIGDNIRVTVVEVNGMQVRLGFEAGDDIPIHREEIYQRIKTEKLRIKQ